jgi:hypothetical protein
VKAFFCLLLFFAGIWVDEAQDRTAIDKVITALNHPVSVPGYSRRMRIPP